MLFTSFSYHCGMELLLTPTMVWTMTLITLWSLPFKAVALWKAANRGEKIWFVVLLVVNTAAILEIFYLFFIIPRASKKSGE